MPTLPCPNCGKPLVVSKIPMEKNKIGADQIKVTPSSLQTPHF